MLFGISLTVWIVMLVCAVIAVLYVLIVDKKEGKRAEKRKYLAILMCIAIAVLATVLSKQQAYVGAPMIGLIVGILIVNIVPEGKMSKEFKSGTVFAGKRYLSLGIVFLGATLAFSDLFSAVYALPLVLFNMALAFAVSYLVGRKVLHVSGNTCALVGSGTCVCGGTAIATISPIVKAKEEETAYAMTAIFLFDLLACFMYPYLAIRLGYTPTQFGFLAGMLVAGGFGMVMRATGGVNALVERSASALSSSHLLAATVITLIGLVVTMGIGTSFGTIPVIAVLFVPLCTKLGFSPAATILMISSAAALGDAGSPASDATLGPTCGLNADGQHDHIWDTCVPTFGALNIPLMIGTIIIAQFI